MLFELWLVLLFVHSVLVLYGGVRYKIAIVELTTNNINRTAPTMMGLFRLALATATLLGASAIPFVNSVKVGDKVRNKWNFC